MSPMHMGDYPLSLQEAAAAVRRRCTSENLTTMPDSPGHSGYGQFGLTVPRSPLSLSIDEDLELPAKTNTVPEMKKDFMTRSVDYFYFFI